MLSKIVLNLDFLFMSCFENERTHFTRLQVLQNLSKPLLPVDVAYFKKSLQGKQVSER
jgi:hypothetical protein